MHLDLVGFEAVGRRGTLGVVMETDPGNPGRASEVRIMGGVSGSLVYVIPVARIRTIARSRRTVVLDVDDGDFLPSLRPDGVVELRVARA